MKTATKWACALASCICCGILGTVGATVAEAAARHQSVGRMLYLGLLLAFATLAWVMFNLPTWLDSVHYVASLATFHGCSAGNATAAAADAPITIVDWLLQHELGTAALSVPDRLCYGSLSVLRVMMPLAAFHALMAVIMVGATSADTASARYELQHGWWSVKLLFIGLLTVASFIAVSNALVSAYYWVAFVGSILFIITQVALLIDFAHRTTSYFALGYTKAAQHIGRPGRCAAGCGLIVAVVLAYAGAAVFMGLAIITAASQGSCAVSWNAIVMTAVLSLMVTLGAIVAYRSSRGGLVPASIVVLYGAYLTWSALTPMALRDAGCHPVEAVAAADSGDSAPGFIYVSRLMGLHDMSRDVQQLILLGTAAVALLYATMRTSLRASEEESGDGDEERARVVSVSETIEESEDNAASSTTTTGRPTTYNFSLFHAIFALAVCYATMVLLGWRYVDIGALHGASAPGTTTPSPPGQTIVATIFVNYTANSLWIKTATAWLALVLYMWTVCAPLVRARCRR